MGNDLGIFCLRKRLLGLGVCLCSWDGMGWDEIMEWLVSIFVFWDFGYGITGDAMGFWMKFKFEFEFTEK